MADYTDSFTNSDDTPLSTHNALWVRVTTGILLLQVDGNECGAVDYELDFAAYQYNQSVGSAHYSRCTLGQVGIQGGIGPAVRLGAAASDDFFYCLYDFNGTLYNGECIGGTATDWDSGLAGPGASEYGLEIDESTTTTVYYKVAGSTVETYTGKSELTGGKAGICAIGVTTGPDARRIDNWEGGDVGGAPAEPHPPLSHITNRSQAPFRASNY